MKKSHKAWRKQVTPPMKYGPMANARRIMRKHHLEQHPDCTYGDEPHFVPPSMGDVGFFLCDPPADTTNHTRNTALIQLIEEWAVDRPPVID